MSRSLVIYIEGLSITPLNATKKDEAERRKMRKHAERKKINDKSHGCKRFVSVTCSLSGKNNTSCVVESFGIKTFQL